MDEIQRAGGKLLYDPALFVYRRPRRTLGAFAKMLRTYGRGRAEQFRATPTFGSALNFVPPLFLVYLLTLPAVWAVTLVPAAEWERDLYELPLFFYGMAVLLQVIALIPSGGAVRGLCALPLIVLSHLLYGFGFWHGLFTRLKPPGETSTVPVKLEILRKE